MSTIPVETLQPAATPQVERHGYLFGQKIAASMSPPFHQTIFDELHMPWAQHRLDSADIPAFLKLIQDPSCFGSSVTMPNKVAIMPYLDSLTEECIEVGACNTIFFELEDGQRKLRGANTDVIGVRESFYQNIENADAVFHDRPAMVIGGGGAARSAVYALHKWMRATKIYLVNRDAREVEAVITDCGERGYGDGLVHVSSVQQAQALDAPGAIVACVPDFPPKTREEIIAREIIETILKKDRKGAMLEMCYNPVPYTELGGIAEREGWQVILGTEAMIWQGFEQCKLWTGLQQSVLPVAKCKEVIATLITQRSRL